MNIFRRIWLSVSSSKYYQELIIKKSGRGAAGYYIKFALLGALAAFLVFMATQFSDLRSGVKTVPVDQLVDYYPEELVLTWDRGELRTNVSEPYLVPLPEAWREEDRPVPNGSSKPVAYLAVIDTKNSLSVEQFSAYGTFIWLGQKQFMVGDAKGEVRILPYNNQTSFTLSREVIERWGEYAKTFFHYLPLVFLPLIYLGVLFYFSYLLIYLLVAALLVWLILVIKKVPNASYWLAYKLGLHLLTLPILVRGALTLLTDFYLPLGVFSLILLVMAAVLIRIENKV